MKDGIAGVLPTLLGQALRGPALVLDKAIAIPIAVVVSPGKRLLDMGPECANEIEVRGPFVELSSELASGPLCAGERN